MALTKLDIVFQGFNGEIESEQCGKIINIMKLLLASKKEEDRILFLMELARRNCYIAARCCILESDKKIVYEIICNKCAKIICTILSDVLDEIQYIILSLYYLNEYQKAAEFIFDLLNHSDEEFFEKFLNIILITGLESSEDQIYFLCHCYYAQGKSQNLRSRNVLLKLTSSNNYRWKCMVDEEELYYPSLKQMINELLKERQYRALHNLMLILGENTVKGKNIIGKATDSENRGKFVIKYLPALQIEFNEEFDKNWSWLYDRIDFELRYVRGMHSTFYYKGRLFSWLNEIQDYDKKKIFYLFKIAVIECMENINNRKFSVDTSCLAELMKNDMSFDELYDDEIIREYLLLMDNLFERLLEYPERGATTILKKICRVNIWHKNFDMKQISESSRNIFDQYVLEKKENYIDIFKSKIQELMNKLRKDSERNYKYFSENTSLKIFFDSNSSFELKKTLSVFAYNYDESIQSIKNVSDEKFGVNLKPIVDSKEIFLRYGKHSEYECQISMNGEIYNGFKVPSGKYRIQRTIGSFQTMMVYKSVIGKNIYKKKHIREIPSMEKYIILQDDEILVLQPECECILHRIW